MKFKNLARFAIPLDAKQNLILCISALPTGALRIEIGWTTRINVFRAVKEGPARCFPVPEIWQFLPQVRTDSILNQSLKKATQKLDPCHAGLFKGRRHRVGFTHTCLKFATPEGSGLQR